ncbi:MAG TPA: GMC family oxidoreductase N-terminal domain-containing protein [Solirubrobacteraceae bacterium]|nr:GMC family oxidoreductase N-terminal domain-containing protein [Solirubrobacteraceae bacterium]
MLGAAPIPFRTDADDLLRLVGERMGVGDSYRRPEVSVFFAQDGKQGATVADPFFDGEGPARRTCTRCGSCMIGCRVGAKNTLVKNYLRFAERHGTDILAERTVKEIRPPGAEDGSDGYAITSVRSGARARKRRETITARGVVIAAGAIGTNTLLARAKHTGMLPRLSDRIGAYVRTNSEALLAVTAKDDSHDFADSVAITSSIHPDRHTHIKNVSYGHGGGFMSLLSRCSPAPAAGSPARSVSPARSSATRHRPSPDHPPVELVAAHDDPPGHADPPRVTVLRASAPRQAAHAHHPPGPQHPVATFIPAANRAAEILAHEMDGIAQSNLPEALLNTPAPPTSSVVR